MTGEPNDSASRTTTEMETLHRRVIELLDELRESESNLETLRGEVVDSDAVIEEERRRHRIAYERLLEHNAQLRGKVVAQTKELQRLGRQVASLRTKNEAMQAKFNAVKRVLPGPVRDMAQKFGRRAAGQDEQA
jgi:chromosome segregation ATPase